MNKAANARFAKGSAVYSCRCCKRKTRATGNNDNEHVRLCVQCYDLAGIENAVLDGNYDETMAKEASRLFYSLEQHGVSDPRSLFEIPFPALA